MTVRGWLAVGGVVVAVAFMWGGDAVMTPRRCPHEVQETREGVWTAAVDYHFRCTCPDPENWNCDQYTCLCPERRVGRGGL